MRLRGRRVIWHQSVNLSVVSKESYLEPHLVMANLLSSYQRERIASSPGEGKYISVIYM